MIFNKWHRLSTVTSTTNTTRYIVMYTYNWYIIFGFLALFQTIFKDKNFFDVFLKSGFRAINQTPKRFFKSIVHLSKLRFFMCWSTWCCFGCTYVQIESWIQLLNTASTIQLFNYSAISAIQLFNFSTIQLFNYYSWKIEYLKSWIVENLNSWKFE